MTDEYKKRQLAKRISENADQCELKAILKGSALADDGFYDERVSGASDDYAVDNLPEAAAWQEQDIQLDSAAGDILEELIRRATMMGDAYPFVLSDAQITYKPSKSGFYEYCLAISSAPNITAGDFVNLPRSFERISAYLVQCYLGNDSDHLHVGTPRDAATGKKFVEAMATLHSKSGEWFWGASAGFPSSPGTTGDEGLDFVVWKNAPDGRTGKLFIIGQCACGDDWSDKFTDLSLDKISKWFNPTSYVPPIRAFTVPHHLSDMNLLVALNEAGLIFDRARLTLIAEKIAASTPIYLDHIPMIKMCTDLVFQPAPALT